MKAEIAKKWVAALRSGKYEKGRNWLRRGEEYCCLGVLCELAVKEGIIKPPMILNSDSDVYSYHNNSSLLPDPVMNWAGMKTMSGLFGNNISLTAYNDGSLGLNPHSFQKIADFIEFHVETL